MSQTDAAVTCSGCTRSFRWKPELASRKAKCKCGATVQFPRENPAAEEPELDVLDAPPRGDDGAAAKPDRQAAAAPAWRGCGTPLQPGSVLCVSCGMNQKTGKRLDMSVERAPRTLSSANPNVPTPFAANRTKWLWIAGSAGAAILAVVLAIFVFPEAGAKIFAGIGIVGAIIGSIGLIWAIYVATADNIGLRLACRFVPFIGLVVVIMRSLSDWDEMKAPVLTMLTGMGLGALGLVMWLGAAAHVAG